MRFFCSALILMSLALPADARQRRRQTKQTQTNLITCPDGYQLATHRDQQIDMMLGCRPNDGSELQEGNSVTINCPAGQEGHLQETIPRQQGYLYCLPASSH